MIAAKWLLAYFLFASGPGSDPADPRPCLSETCSAYVVVESEEMCKQAFAMLRENPQVQSVGVCIELGAEATLFTRALTEKEHILLEIKSNEKKGGSAS